MQLVFPHLGALSVALLRHGEQRGPVSHDHEARHGVARLEVDAAHAVGRAAHHAHVALSDVDGLAAGGGDDQRIVPRRDAHVGQLVVIVE